MEMVTWAAGAESAGVYPGSMDVADRLLLSADVAAKTRQDCAPALDDPLGTWRRCRGCSELYWDWRKRGHRRCPACAGQRLVELNIQRSRKSGPRYRETVAAQYAYWLAEAQRLGLSPDAK